MKRQRYDFTLVATILVLSINWTGCSLLGEDEPSAPIVLGESIEGVKLGDSEEEVIAKLGEPDQEMYLDLAGRGFMYLSPDENVEFTLTISDDPALGLGVITVFVYPAYEGKTEHGLGIGSPRSEVIEVLGHPDLSKPSDTYEVGNSRVSFEYREGVVYKIVMA